MFQIYYKYCFKCFYLIVYSARIIKFILFSFDILHLYSGGLFVVLFTRAVILGAPVFIGAWFALTYEHKHRFFICLKNIYGNDLVHPMNSNCLIIMTPLFAWNNACIKISSESNICFARLTGSFEASSSSKLWTCMYARTFPVLFHDDWHVLFRSADRYIFVKQPNCLPVHSVNR